MAVEIDILYEGELHCRATHGPSGTVLVTDAPTDNGGKGESFSPTDLVATALGTCILTIMDLVAGKRRVDLTGTRVHVIKEMAASPLRRISRLRAEITVPASCRVDETTRKILVEKADACPVLASLHPDVEVEKHFVFEEGEVSESRP